MRKVVLIVLRILLGLWICGIVLCLILVKNPFYVRSIDASQTAMPELEDIYNQKYPYVRITNVDLTYTGFYSVSKDQTEITSYGFIGDIGGHSCLLVLDADKVHRLTQDVTNGLMDVSLIGKMVFDSPLLSAAAEDEGSTLAEYMTKYNISSVSIDQYHSDHLQIVLCYVLAVLAAFFLGVSISIEKKRKKVR